MAKEGYTQGTYHFDAKGNRVGASTSSAVAQQKPGEGIVSYVPKVAAPVIPTATGPQSSTVATSGNARGQVGAASNYLDEYNASQQQKDAVNQTASATQLPPEEQGEGDGSKDALSIIDTLTGDNSGSAIKQGMFDSINQQKDAAAQYARDRQKTLRQLSQLQSNADVNTSNLIEDIKTQYDGLVAQQAAKNRQYERGTTVSGLVSGRAQYAPEIQSGLLATAVNYGIQKIMDIQAERAGLITKAEIARNDMQFKILTETSNAIRETYLDERDAARNMQSDLMEADQYGRDLIDYNVKNAAPTIVKLLTGDEKTDRETYDMYAKQIGVPVQNLYAAVDEYKMQSIKDAPGVYGEFLYGQSIGQLPAGVTTPAQYASWKANLGKTPTKAGKTIPNTIANKSGLSGLAGVPYDNFYDAAVGAGGKYKEGANGDAPDWFKAMADEEYQTSIYDYTSLWDAWKNSEGAKQLLTGDSSQSSLEEAISGLSTAEFQ